MSKFESMTTADYQEAVRRMKIAICADKDAEIERLKALILTMADRTVRQEALIDELADALEYANDLGRTRTMDKELIRRAREATR